MQELSDLKTLKQDMRESLLEALIIAKISFSGFCSFCNVRNADIVCDDCGRNSKLCSECDERVHSYCPIYDRYGIVQAILKAIQ